MAEKEKDTSNKNARAKGQPVYDVDEKGTVTGRTKGAEGPYVGGYDPAQKTPTQIFRGLGIEAKYPMRPGQNPYPDSTREGIRKIPGYRRHDPEKVFPQEEDIVVEEYAKGGPVRAARAIRNKGYKMR